MGMVLVMFTAGIVLSSAPSLHADDTDTTAPITTPTTAATTPGSSTVSDCSQYAGLTNRIASCVRDTITNATTAFFTGFYPLISRAIAAAITIGIAIYGAMASVGMVERVGRDTIMLLVKIAMVGFFSANSDWMYSEVITIMDSTASAVVSFAPSSGAATSTGSSGSAQTDFSQIKCLQAMVTAQSSNSTSTTPTTVAGPWMGMDCIIDSVIGIKVSSTGTITTGGTGGYNTNLADADSGMSRGMLYFFFSGMQTSIVGLMIALVGFIFIYGMIHLIIKTLFVYIGAYMGIALLMIVSPIFIPLVLFKQTKDYFDKWVKLVINFVLQPIIMMVFVTFSIAAMDLATYSGGFSIMYSLAGAASQQPGFSVNTFLKPYINPKPVTVAQIKADPAGKPADTLTSMTNGMGLGSKLNPKCLLDKFSTGTTTPGTTTPGTTTPSTSTTDPNCQNVHSIQAWHQAIDWDKLAAARGVTGTGTGTPGQQLAQSVLSSVIFAGIVVFVMNGLLKIVPTIITDLLGDFGQSPNLFKSVGKLPGGQTGAGGVGGMASSVSKAISGMVGGRK
jgi:hypothetical protein